jgi:glutamate-1-semialdehyde 2,1-aminomutase
LEAGFRRAAERHGIKCFINRIGSMITVFFGVERVNNAHDARQSDCAQFARYFHGMLSRGIYLPPAQFEAAFVSLAHKQTDIDRAVAAFQHWTREDARR